MATAPYLISLVLTQATATATAPSRLEIVAAMGDSIGPLTIEIVGITNGIEAMDSNLGGPQQYGYLKLNLPPGTFSATVHDASPAKLPDFTTAPFTVNAPPVVPGCTDPSADNYDPNATDEDGSCVYSPHLLLDDLPELAPLGVPLLVRLRALPISAAVPAPAAVVLDLSALGAAPVQVRLDGYLFTNGPLIVPGRFNEASSLLMAMQAQPALAANYLLTQPSVATVRVEARTPGLPATPTVTVSNPTIVATATPGVAGLWSQARWRWRCYLEVWAGCGSTFGGVTDKKLATLAQRITLDYRADNAYLFDVAAALRQFTDHQLPAPDGSCPDRLVGYFLRFGEEYADTPTGLARVRTTYESGVQWGLEAMQVPEPSLDGAYILTSRPAPWQVAPGQRMPAFLLQAPAASRAMLLRYRLAAGAATYDYTYSQVIASGQVTQAGQGLPVSEDAEVGELVAADTGAVLAQLQFVPEAPQLLFVNRQGGFDVVLLAGSRDESGKRTAATYANVAGPQNLSAEVLLTSRLNTGLLDFATWDWLRRELAVSPAAWLDTGSGPQAMLIAEVTTAADAIKDEYSLSLDLQPAPVRGLVN